MDLTLDYNIELFPLQNGQSFALALASSLLRNPQGPAGTTEDEDKDRDVWRPDAKGRRGLDDDYEYVMYGKVSRSMFVHPSSPPTRLRTSWTRPQLVPIIFIPLSKLLELIQFLRCIGLMEARQRLCECSHPHSNIRGFRY